MLHFVPLKDGEQLFEEHSVGSQMYIVYQGSCKAVANITDDKTGDVRQVVLNTFKEGDFFGEISLLLAMPRTASIIGISLFLCHVTGVPQVVSCFGVCCSVVRPATSPSLLLELRKDDFQKFLKLTPNLPFNDLLKRRFANHFKKYKVSRSIRTRHS